MNYVFIGSSRAMYRHILVIVLLLRIFCIFFLFHAQVVETAYIEERKKRDILELLGNAGMQQVYKVRSFLCIVHCIVVYVIQIDGFIMNRSIFSLCVCVCHWWLVKINFSLLPSIASFLCRMAKIDFSCILITSHTSPPCQEKK